MSFEQHTVALDELEARTAELAVLPVFHGSPVLPENMGELIEPQQSLTRSSDGNMVPHGPAAISFSTSVHPFPKIRSLLHSNHPLLRDREDRNLVFARELNCQRIPFYFVGSVVLDALVEGAGKGSVYGCDGNGSTEIFPDREDLGERRASMALYWKLVAETSVSDLPDSLQVIDAPKVRVWEFLKILPQYEDPTALANTLRIPLIGIKEWLS